VCAVCDTEHISFAEDHTLADSAMHPMNGSMSEKLIV